MNSQFFTDLTPPFFFFFFFFNSVCVCVRERKRERARERERERIYSALFSFNSCVFCVHNVVSLTL